MSAVRDKRKITTVLVTSAALILVLLLVLLYYFTSVPLSSSSFTASSSISIETTQTSTVTLGTIASGDNVTSYSLSEPCNCTVYVPQQVFPTLGDLVQGSPAVLLARVTSATTLSVMGIPFTLYGFTVIQTLIPLPSSSLYKPTPGTNATIAWIGGTVNGTTMTASGYPTLTVGGTYILFLSDSPGYNLYSYWGHIEDGIAESTTGGAQGLFYVQAGEVFSLDHLYPQADSWLPVKVDGVPLAQFIADVQSA